MTEGAYWAERCRYCEAPLRRDRGCSMWYGEPHDLPYRERSRPGDGGEHTTAGGSGRPGAARPDGEL